MLCRFFYPDPPRRGSGKSGRAAQDAGRCGQKKKGYKMNDISEVWLEVPETAGRYMISNKGHLKQMGKRQRRGKHEVMVFSNKISPIVSGYISGKLGWYVYMDNQKHFFCRDILMSLFKGIPIELDKSEVLDAIKLRQETFRNLPEFRKSQTAGEGATPDVTPEQVGTANEKIIQNADGTEGVFMVTNIDSIRAHAILSDGIGMATESCIVPIHTQNVSAS